MTKASKRRIKNSKYSGIEEIANILTWRERRRGTVKETFRLMIIFIFMMLVIM